MDAERALFEGQIQGLVVTFYQNERPLGGLAGIIDWYFRGALSQYIQKGAIAGKAGECVYIPLVHLGSTYHIILAGAGDSTSPGHRHPLPATTLRALQQNLISLRLPSIGISMSDFGQSSPDSFAQSLKGVSLWIAP